MTTKQAFRLTTTHPAGKVTETDYPELRDAQLAISYCLYYNGHADKRTAQTACMLKPGSTLAMGGATFAMERITVRPLTLRKSPELVTA